MSIFTKRTVMLSAVLLGLTMAGFPAFFAGHTDRLVYTFGIFGGLIWGRIVLRCPCCGAPLPLQGWCDLYCPKCGENLKDPSKRPGK